MNLLRFGVSIEEPLLADFDAHIREKGFANRSDALRALIRAALLETRARETPDMEVVGTIALVYDHSVSDLSSRLTELQHGHYKSIVSTLHVHVDQHNCLEVLVVRGRQSAVRRISDALIGTRGVRQGKLIINSDVAAHRHGEHGHGAHPHAAHKDAGHKGHGKAGPRGRRKASPG